MAKTRRDLADNQSAQDLGVYDMNLEPVAETEGRTVLHHVSGGEQHVKISKTPEELRRLGVPESRWWRA